MARTTLFSETLGKWLRGKHDKTLLSLTELFAEKAFAIIFLLLMALPALPVPTGGVTHVTEVITMLLALEFIAGRQTVWLPGRWLGVDVGKHVGAKATARLISIIKWFERWARPRARQLFQQQIVRTFIGIVVLLFTIAAFIAPPFSGLDTLPALGVVIISLSLIFEDLLLLVIGIIVGAVGIGLEITLGTGLYHSIQHLHLF
jgi:hypothetical protein